MRLAGRVFAPHYVAALPRRAARELVVTAAQAGGEVVTHLSSGDRFELLDLAGGRAWGIAVAAGLVGYVDADGLDAGQ